MSETRSNPSSPIKASGVGCLVTVVCALAAFVVTFTLAAIWAFRLPVEPDFGTNGINWYFAGIGMFNLMAVPVLFVLAFCLIIPLRYSRALRSAQLLDIRSWVGSMLAIELVAGVVAIAATSSPTDRMILGMMFGPLLLVTATGGWWFVRRLNTGLSSVRRQA